MKIELSSDDLQIIAVALDNLQIKGSDAIALSKIIIKINKSFERNVKKDK